MTSLGAALPRLPAHAGAKAAPLLHLAAVWADIVGAELARQSRPEKLARSRARSPTGPPGGTLTVRCTGAAAVELQHRAPQILERVNAFFGFTAASRLALAQGPLPARAGARRAAPVQPLDRSTADAMQRATAKIADPELRAALLRLAQAVVRHPGPAKK